MIEVRSELIEDSGENTVENRNAQQIKLSVIVPVYNVETYIRRCLDSILSQTYQNLEIILVDDGSTDRSGEICDAYAAKDDRIQVIHKENDGIVGARKAGILCATGEYTTHVDSDDWIEEGAYEAMINRLEEYRPDMLVFGYKKEHAGFTEEYRQGIKEGYYQGKAFWEEFNKCVKETPFFNQPIDMILWNKAIKTGLCKKYQTKCREELGDNGDDDSVVFPCLLALESIYIDAECFYHYCVRKKSVSWNPVKGNYESCKVLAEHLIKSYAERVNSSGMGKNFLLYKLYYHLMLNVPYKLVYKDECVLYPQMRPENNIIIYGKGVFANRLIKCLGQLNYCNIVDVIDKADIGRLKGIDGRRYDYIVIAIFHSFVVSSAVELIKKQGIASDRILCIEKENLLVNLLPEEIRIMWEELEDREKV